MWSRTIATDRSAFGKIGAIGAARGLFGLLILTLVTGLLVPVYTDEVAWRFQLGRWWLDGGVDRAIGESCGSNQVIAPPLFMMPVRGFSSALTMLAPDPLFVRGAGVALAVVAIFAIRAVVRRTAPDAAGASRGEIYAWALLGLGVLPYLLIWSRPEQPVLLALLAAMAVALAPRAIRVAEPAAAIVAIVAVAAVAMSYHLKALFYLPAFLVALWLCAPGARRWRVRAVASTVLLLLAAIAFRYWSIRFACPDDPLLAAKLRSENLSAVLAGGDWRALTGALPQMTRQALPNLYINIASPADTYMSAWLPPGVAAPALVVTWHVAVTAAWFAGLAIGGVALVAAARDPARRRPLWLALALIGCATGWAALQVNKNAYESALYLPVVVLALGLVGAGSGRGARWPVAALASVSVASQLLLIASYTPRLWAADAPGGAIAAQPYSLSPIAYPRASIVRAGARCGVSPDPATRLLLVDDLTYFAYAGTRWPLHRLGVLSDWNGMVGDPVAWLRRRGSPGAVLACQSLPPGLRAMAVRSGDLCCLRLRP